jgi:alpha-D-xyloside xylohydrolase
LDTLFYSVFKFGTKLNDLLEIEADIDGGKEGLELFLLPGKPLEVIRQYSNITGKPALPPKWSFGPWMSSNNWDSQAETVKQVELTQKHQIPATVIVLEQWSDEATFYVFNDAQYEMKDGHSHLNYDDFEFPEWGRWPNPQKMVEFLHESGLKVLLWQIPIEKHMYGVLHAQKDEDERAMLEAGYHVQLSNGEPYRIPYNWFKDCLILDFSNPAAKEWWFNKRKYLLDIGIDGFKTDGGECVFGNDLLFNDGTAAEKMRNRYPNDYIGSYYEFVQQHVKGGGITFSRAGYVGLQKFPLHWAGDERSTFEAFRASIIAGLSCSMSGIPFWGWDLAGFHGDIPTAELFIRSTQMAAFCPVMQYHAESKGEFNQDRTPWNIAERTKNPLVLEQYKKFADLRMNLLPYVYEQASSCSKLGVPLMRAMFPVFIKQNSVIPFNLAKTYQLCSDVGNRVDQYDQLCLVIYLIDQVNYDFADDLGNTIHLSAVQQSGTISAQYEIYCQAPVTFIFRKVRDAIRVTGNSEILNHVHTLVQLSDHTFYQSNEELYIRLSGKQSKGTLEIAAK